MIGSANGYADMESLSTLLIKSALDRIRNRIENAPEDNLKDIVNNYKVKPWYRKLGLTIESNESILEYLCARDMLNGAFSWKQLI